MTGAATTTTIVAAAAVTTSVAASMTKMATIMGIAQGGCHNADILFRDIDVIAQVRLCESKSHAMSTRIALLCSNHTIQCV